MIAQNPNECWSNKAFPASLLGRDRRSSRRPKGYKVEPASFILFISALEAKRGRWLVKRLHLTVPTISLPSENIAAIKLLDSWLSTPNVERDEWQERLERLIEENRL